MNCRDVIRAKQKLDNLFDKVNELPNDAIELRAHWARYLCVLVAGFLEQSLRSIYGEYANRTSAPNTASFVVRRLRGFRNANMQAILGLAASFNSGWHNDLKLATDGELRDAVDTIVSNRHLIAHGKDVGITFVGIKTYYERAYKVVESIDEQCNR